MAAEEQCGERHRSRSETRTNYSIMADPLFAPEVRLLLEKDDREGMATFCETLHPATVAEALEGGFTVPQVWQFLHSTSVAKQAAIFAYFPLEWQVQMAEGVGRPEMARLIEAMSHDDRADLLRKLEPRVREGLLRLVDEADRRDIAKLVNYAENTAGALMTTDYAWLPANISAEEALERLRLQAPDSETIYYIYVVDDQRRLLGVLSLRDLIMAQRRAMLRDVMETQIVTVHDTDDREKVARDMGEYDLLAIPVVDADGRLVGIVTADDVLDVVESEATEDIHRMGAVGPLEENYLEASFVTIWRKRAVWLACLFFAELFTFSALAHFEDAIAEVVVLSLFVPLCISTGGNSGSQAATLITRAMALGQVKNSDWFRVLRHEIGMGLVLGLTLGAIGFVRASFTPESVRSSSPPRNEAFTVTMPRDVPLVAEQIDGETVVKIPKGAEQVIEEAHDIQVMMAKGEELKEVSPPDASGIRKYRFPPKCTLRHAPVDRTRLSIVIALAVAAICLWGTLMGSMLPLFFKRVGVDPGIASSPFVATFVDVTGIVIYFSIAKVVLAEILT
jgi:magnesium transporter